MEIKGQKQLNTISSNGWSRMAKVALVEREINTNKNNKDRLFPYADRDVFSAQYGDELIPSESTPTYWQFRS